MTTLKSIGSNVLRAYVALASSESRPKRRKGKQTRPQNRHGIPLLKSSDDPGGSFQKREAPGDKAEDKIGEADFSRMVEETLSDADYQEMIRAKKTGGQDGRKGPLPRRPRFRPPPRAEIDLHGCTAGQGRLRAEAFILSARARGLDAVRIIVGRGIHSQGGAAVLPGVVEDLAMDLKKQGLVDSFDWEGGGKSRSGALIVYPAPE